MLLVLCLLSASTLGAGGKGQKHYKQGLSYEASQQWERAAEEFALAVAAEPANIEYQLHYRRAIFNASQLMTQRGHELAERGDYVGAYNAFRRAYGYDPVNELALSMMERMRRMQLEKGVAGNDRDGSNDTGEAVLPNVQISPSLYERGSEGRPGARRHSDAPPAPPARAETHRVIKYSGDLDAFIRYLAKQIRLNTVFDRDFPKRSIEVDLEEVTAAQALDFVFLSQGLFYQKLNRRTILVSDQSKRPQYLQLVLRTFYLFNIDPNDAKAIIQSAIPPQAGRQPVITPNKATNSLTVRDTPENMRLIGDLIKSIDKERAEVVMDVNIYEVSRSDLMQFGNQLGTDVGLSNLGGIQKGLAVIGGSRGVVTQGLGAVTAPTALGAALIIPATQLQMLQRKSQTRLIASTQVHAFDGEKSTAHIGQRVPVQTAAVAPFGFNAGSGEGNTQAGVTTGLFGSNGYPVIQYEKTGLTLEFTPQVFPNLDVQVKMSIKSNDVVGATGGATLTPTFTERNIEGTARIQNNRTMMIASVAQNSQSRGRQGLPVLGLVPILGRLFTAPRRDDHSTDIVIAVTPHVMRAPTFTPRDEESHPSGTMQTPTPNTLEAMLQEAEREEQLIAARTLPRNAYVEVGDTESPTFVPAPRALLVDPNGAPPSRTPAASQGTSQPPPGGAMRGVSADHVRTAATDMSEATDGSRAAAPAFAPVGPSVIPATSSPAGPGRVVYSEAIVGAARPRSVSVVKKDGGADPLEPAKTYASTSNYEASAGPRARVGNVANRPRSAVELRLSPEQQNLRAGERTSIRLVMKTDAPLGLIRGTLRYDPRVITIRSITPGNFFGDSRLTPSVSAKGVTDGVLALSVLPHHDAPVLMGAGVLITLEVEAIGAGESFIMLDEANMQLRTTDGRALLLKSVPCSLVVE